MISFEEAINFFLGGGPRGKGGIYIHSYTYGYIYQQLIQKEKVDIDGKKGAQIAVVAKTIAHQGWSDIMKYQQAIHYISFFIFLLLCFYYTTGLIKKLELPLLVTFIFNKD